jgi:hypothetical protein
MKNTFILFLTTLFTPFALSAMHQPYRRWIITAKLQQGNRVIHSHETEYKERYDEIVIASWETAPRTDEYYVSAEIIKVKPKDLSDKVTYTYYLEGKGVSKYLWSETSSICVNQNGEKTDKIPLLIGEAPHTINITVKSTSK